MAHSRGSLVVAHQTVAQPRDYRRRRRIKRTALGECRTRVQRFGHAVARPNRAIHFMARKFIPRNSVHSSRSRCP